MITNRQLHKLRQIRNSCQEGMDGTWDCGTEEGKESFQPMIDDLNDVIAAVEADWYTPCAMLCCWLYITDVGLDRHGRNLLSTRIWNDFRGMLRTRVRDDAVIWAMGEVLLSTLSAANIDIPDGVWEPFSRIHDLCDPEFGNRNMN